MKCINTLYITDNILYLKNKDNIYKYKIKNNIVRFGKIINESRFINEYNKFIKLNKLNQGIIKDTIKIIVIPTYTNIDILYLKELFYKLNYRKVLIDKTSKHYNLNKHIAYLNCNDSFRIINYLNDYKEYKYIFINNDNFKNNIDLMKYIKYIIDDRDLVLIGNGSILLDIFNNFEDMFSNKTYLHSNHDIYLIV